MDTQVNETQVMKARGRRDRNSGQEAVVKASVVRERMDELVLLYNASSEAATAYSDAIKAAAEKAGLLANCVAKVVKAHATDKVEERKREAGQLVLLFDEAAA